LHKKVVIRLLNNVKDIYVTSDSAPVKLNMMTMINFIL